MKKVISLLVVTFLLIQPGIGFAALSLEAIEVVEQLRRRLKPLSVIQESSSQSENVAAKIPKKISSVKNYVVGKELQEALQNLREKVYGSQNIRFGYRSADEKKSSYSSNLENRTKRLKVAVKKVKVPELYVPGLLLRQSLDRVKETRPLSDLSNESVSTLVIAEPESALATRKNEIPCSMAGCEKSVISSSKETSVRSSPQKKLKKTQKKLVKTEVKKLVKTEVLASQKRLAAPSRGKPGLEDIKLNGELKKHEFKMPGSYRIIVR